MTVAAYEELDIPAHVRRQAPTFDYDPPVIPDEVIPDEIPRLDRSWKDNRTAAERARDRAQRIGLHVAETTHNRRYLPTTAAPRARYRSLRLIGTVYAAALALYGLTLVTAKLVAVTLPLAVR